MTEGNYIPTVLLGTFVADLILEQTFSRNE